MRRERGKRVERERRERKENEGVKSDCEGKGRRKE